MAVVQCQLKQCLSNYQLATIRNIFHCLSLITKLNFCRSFFDICLTDTKSHCHPQILQYLKSLLFLFFLSKVKPILRKKLKTGSKYFGRLKICSLYYLFLVSKKCPKSVQNRTKWYKLVIIENYLFPSKSSLSEGKSIPSRSFFKSRASADSTTRPSLKTAQ